MWTLFRKSFPRVWLIGMEYKSQRSSRLALVIKAMVSIGFCFFIFQRIDLIQVKQVLKGMQLLPFFVATACLSGSVLLMSRRWQVLLQLHGQGLSFSDLNRIVWIGFFLNQGLPSSIGGDVYRIYILGRRLNSTILSLMSVLIERFYGLFSFALIASLAILFQFQYFPFPLLRDTGWITLALMGFAIGGIVLLRTFPLSLIDNLKERYFLKFLHEGIQALKALNLGYYGSFRILLWTLLSHVLNIGCFIMLANGLSIPQFGWRVALIVVPIVHIVSSLPISLAGWGVREGIMVYSLGYFGIPLASALSLSLSYGLMQFLLAGVGLYLWFGRNKSEPFLKQKAINFNINA